MSPANEEVLREVRETRAEVVQVRHAVEIHDGRSKGYAERIGERVGAVEVAVERFEAAASRLAGVIEERIPKPNGSGRKNLLLEPGVVLWLILGALLAGGTEGLKGLLELFR